MKHLKIGLAACATAALLLVGLSRAGGDKKLEVGDPAPSFQSVDDQGKVWKSKDHIGKKIVVVYFYPADFTGGCTKQACGFRDDFNKLADLGVEVVGVSGDTAKTHDAFKKAHSLNFTLLADEKGEVAGKFGVPFSAGEKTAVYKDQKFVRGGSAARWTFVIGVDGKIAHKNTKVAAADDSKNIEKIVKELKK